jgi:hypothetical protein
MSEPHWHKWLSGDEWAKMGPFPNEQACPYCRVERAEARVKELEERIRRALNELGIPQSGYPAPVANAVSILRGEE